MPPPESPISPLAPKLEVKTLVVPRTSTISPIELTEANLSAFNSDREQTSKDMISALKRRTLVIEDEPLVHVGDPDAQKTRRHSSPAEVHHSRRVGFEHPVLSLPGGF